MFVWDMTYVTLGCDEHHTENKHFNFLGPPPISVLGIDLPYSSKLVLKGDGRNQGRLNAVSQRKLGLHTHAGQPLRTGEEQQKSSPETDTNQDPDRIE
jgi:hypothetical protein